MWDRFGLTSLSLCVNLDTLVNKKVGDGKNTRFWEDVWIGNRPLKIDYARIYRLDKDMEPLVVHRKVLNPADTWLRRPPRGGVESDQWDGLITLIGSYIFSEQRDRWMWSGDGTGSFSVASARQIIDKQTLITGDSPTRWCKEIPIKVNVFIWRMCLDRLPTRVNLSARGLEVQSLSCGTCDQPIDSVTHIMLDCTVAKDIWRLVEQWWKIDIPLVGSINDFFDWVENLKISKVCKKAFLAVTYTTTWMLWKFRNESLFGNVKPKKACIFDDIVTYSFYWVTSRNPKLRVVWLGFVCDPITALNSL